MIESSDFRTKRLPLNHGAGHMPALGFGTLIPDAAATSWQDAGTGAVGLGGAAWHGFAYNTQDCGSARENFNISALPEEALDEINRIQTRQRFNEVVKTGSPGFIPQGR